MQGRRLRFGDYEADFGLRELRKGGTRLALQHKPFHVLELLLRHPGQLVTRQQLFDFLWPDSHVSFERGLNSAVNSLRQALGESSRECHYIETRPGLGYRFVAPIQEIAEGTAEAYQDCLKGRYLLDRFSEEDIYKALAYFHSAAADDTYNALANAGIADAYCQLVLACSVSPARVCALARSSADLALHVGPDLPQAYISQARVKMLFDWDWNGAREALVHAIQLDPQSTSAYTLQSALFCILGDDQMAMESCVQALAIDPLSFQANLQLVACFFAVRDFQRVINQCWNMLSLASSFAPAQLWLARAYEQLGMTEEAIIEFQNAKISPACRVQAVSGLARWSSDSSPGFPELSDLALSRHVAGYWYAVAYAGRKEYGQALSRLDQSLQARDPALLAARSDPRFDCLREFPAFQNILTHFD